MSIPLDVAERRLEILRAAALRTGYTIAPKVLHGVLRNLGYVMAMSTLAIDIAVLADGGLLDAPEEGGAIRLTDTGLAVARGELHAPGGGTPTPGA